MDQGLNGAAAAVVNENEQPAADAAPPDPRQQTIARRAKVLSLLEGSGIVGTSISDIVHDAKRLHPEATVEVITDDLAAIMETKFGERRDPRAPGGPHLYALTLLGENSLRDYAYHIVAERTLKDPAQRPEPQEADKETSWSDVAKASEQKELQAAGEKIAETLPKGGKGKKKGADEPSKQLSISDEPGTFLMDLPCPVPEEERIAATRAHLAVCDEQDALGERKKAAMKRFAEELEDIEERERQARAESDRLNRGTAVKPVKCSKRLDGSTMRIFRSDTGEQIEERAATAAELEAANPPPPTAPTPEGAEVREPNGADKPTDTGGDTSDAKAADSQADKTDTGKDKAAKGKRGGKGKAPVEGKADEPKKSPKAKGASAAIN